MDGARHQLDLITAEAERRGVTVHIAIDLIHVLEYLWDAARCLHQAGDPAAEAFVARQARTILGGGAEQVAAALQIAARATRLKKNRRKGIDDAVSYLRNKAAYLRYDTALEHGWPIRDGNHRGRLPPPGQRPTRHHRGSLGTRRRRGRPQAPRPARQRRLQHLLDLAREAGVRPLPRPTDTHSLIQQHPHRIRTQTRSPRRFTPPQDRG